MKIKKFSIDDDEEASAASNAEEHVHARVLRYLRRGLMVGAFLPGQAMSLRKLGAALGTSPMPIRGALSRLVAASALEETENGSVRVPRLSLSKLNDLFDIREVVEGAAAELAGKSERSSLATELSRINNQLRVAIEKRDILKCLSLNQKFHFHLYSAANSEVLMRIIESLWLQCGPTMYVSLLVPSMPWDASAHQRVITAVEQHDGKGARKGISRDIRANLRALLSIADSLPFVEGVDLHFDH